jgi:hypothetical protein
MSARVSLYLVALVGGGLIFAGFVVVLRQGGWQRALQPRPDGRWSSGRRLLFAGAIIGTIYFGLVLVAVLFPGWLPWLG